MQYYVRVEYKDKHAEKGVTFPRLTLRSHHKSNSEQ